MSSIKSNEGRKRKIKEGIKNGGDANKGATIKEREYMNVRRININDVKRKTYDKKNNEQKSKKEGIKTRIQ